MAHRAPALGLAVNVALVLGGAMCLQDDLAAARAMLPLGAEPIIVATNHAGRDYPGPLPHWVTFHAEIWPRWIRDRHELGHPPADLYWTAERRGLDGISLPLRRVSNWGGSSGLLAVTAALELGAEHVILCGVPLDRDQAHYDDPKPWRDAGNYRRAWISHKPEMDERVRSMSGWTKELLGPPTRRWLRLSLPV